MFAVWSIPYHDYAAMPALVRVDVEEGTLSTTDWARRTLPRNAQTKTGDWLRKVLLGCGPLSALVYIGWHEVAAPQWAPSALWTRCLSRFTSRPRTSVDQVRA